MHGAILAAEDPRIAAAVLIAATPRWGDWFLPFWPIAGDRHDYLRALSPLDPISRVGDLAPRPVCFQFARGDFFIAGDDRARVPRRRGRPEGAARVRRPTTACATRRRPSTERPSCASILERAGG